MLHDQSWAKSAITAHGVGGAAPFRIRDQYIDSSRGSFRRLWLAFSQ
jgi:hypothetical protein